MLRKRVHKAAAPAQYLAQPEVGSDQLFCATKAANLQNQLFCIAKVSNQTLFQPVCMITLSLVLGFLHCSRMHILLVFRFRYVLNVRYLSINAETIVTSCFTNFKSLWLPRCHPHPFTLSSCLRFLTASRPSRACFLS